ncbi:ABC-type nitrate/sulfonate/bicarbonate transport system substrate-binding protein [Bradyrhizobium sp. USDA 4516]
MPAIAGRQQSEEGPMISFKLARLTAAVALVAIGGTGISHAETIRVAVGTQDTTINCATGGLLIRQLKLLEKFLPHDGKYKDVTYDIQWKNFTSGAPLTNEMVAGKLDFGAMADFPGSLNGGPSGKSAGAASSSACCRAAPKAAEMASWCR